MRLTQQQIADVVAHLKKFRRSPCPVCHTDKWTVSNTLFQLPEYEAPWPFGPPPPPPPAMTLPGFTPSSVLSGYKTAPSTQVYPLIPVTCGTCGYVYFMSGIALNIVAAT
jgi:hypothetical protein